MSNFGRVVDAYVTLQQSTFTEDSKRFCDACKVNVNIGLGGEYNWKAHTNSDDHKKKAKLSGQHNAIESYFGAPRPRPSTSSLAPPANLSSAISIPSAATLAHRAQSAASNSRIILDIDEYHPEVPTDSADLVSHSPPPRSVFDRIREAAGRLPSSIPFATAEDVLARFSGVPSVDPTEYDDPWEMADRALNPVVGYGCSVSEIASIIRRGEKGVEGLCNWMELCVSSLHIDPALLEGKAGRLLEAINLL